MYERIENANSKSENKFTVDKICETRYFPKLINFVVGPGTLVTRSETFEQIYRIKLLTIEGVKNKGIASKANFMK